VACILALELDECRNGNASSASCRWRPAVQESVLNYRVKGSRSQSDGFGFHHIHVSGDDERFELGIAALQRAMR